MTAPDTTFSAEHVAELVAKLLHLPEPVPLDAELIELDGFSSLFVAELVERLEEELCRELPPELIVPETFESPAALAAALGLDVTEARR